MKLVHILVFFLFYVKEVVLSTFKVARDVLSPNPKTQSCIIAIPLDPMSDMAVATLANLISMTPGTLSLHYDRESKELVVHTMYVESESEFIESIRSTYMQRILKIFGKVPDDR